MQRTSYQENEWQFQVSNHHEFTLECQNLLNFSFFDVFLCCPVSEKESASEIDVSNQWERQAQTWYFWACVLFKDGQTFSDLLNACTKQLDTSIGTASVIILAFAETDGLKTQDSCGLHLEGFIHASKAIGCDC